MSGPVVQSWLESEHKSDLASGGASDRESEMTLGRGMAWTSQLASSEEVLEEELEMMLGHGMAWTLQLASSEEVLDWTSELALSEEELDWTSELLSLGVLLCHARILL